MDTRVGLALLAVVGWGAFTYVVKHPPKTPPVVETKEVERVVTKVVVKEVTKPDGTVTRETTSFQAQDKAKIAQVPVKAPLSHWSLGLSAGITPDRIFPPQPIYGLSLGHRLGTTPLWIQTTLNTNKEVTFGILAEF